jgi:hypothetical protein
MFRGISSPGLWGPWGVMDYYNTQGYWVVLCNNRRFHHKGNLSCEHRIVLGETDAFSPPPALDGQLKARCDNCGEEYSYKPKDLTARRNRGDPRASLRIPCSRSNGGEGPRLATFLTNVLLQPRGDRRPRQFRDVSASDAILPHFWWYSAAGAFASPAITTNTQSRHLLPKAMTINLSPRSQSRATLRYARVAPGAPRKLGLAPSASE